MNELKRKAMSLKAHADYRSLDELEKAVKMNLEGGISERIAAEVCGIKKSAIGRAKKALKENREMGLMGRPRLLKPKFEADLVKEIDNAEAQQKNLTLEQAKEIFINTPGVNLAKGIPVFSNSYFDRVFEENELKKRSRISIEQRILTPETISHYMTLMSEQMTKYQFPPQLIFNFDETALEFTAPKLKVVSRAKSPRPFVEIAEKGQHISLGLCIAASGQALRPLVILPLKYLPLLSPEVVDFYAFAGSDAGFMTKEIWLETLNNTIIPDINNVRIKSGLLDAWALLVIDGHNSRDLAEAVEACFSHCIILLCMPAHSSAICQPLDLSVNGIFKVNIRNFFKPVEGETLPAKRNRLLFLSIYALQIAFNAYNIQLGFSRAGIYPFSPQAPLKSRYIKTPFAPTPPPKPPKGSAKRVISCRVLTPQNTLRGLPPAPAPKKRAPRLKSAPQRRPPPLPPNSTQVVPINFVITNE